MTLLAAIQGMREALEPFAHCSGLQFGDINEPERRCGHCAGCTARRALDNLRSAEALEKDGRLWERVEMQLHHVRYGDQLTPDGANAVLRVLDPLLRGNP